MDGKNGINISKAIKKYFKEVRVTLHLICDQAREQLNEDERLLCNKAVCHVIELDKVTLAASRAGRAMNILKDGCKRDMFDTNYPMVFCCY